MLRVQDWMTVEPIAISAGASVAEARARMEHHDIRRLLVHRDSGELAGIVTWGDVAEAWPSPFSLLDSGEVRAMMESILVDEIMTTELVVADPETTMAEAASLMFEHRVGALPVVKDGKAIGILTSSDILQGLVRILVHPGLAESHD